MGSSRRAGRRKGGPSLSSTNTDIVSRCIVASRQWLVLFPGLNHRLTLNFGAPPQSLELERHNPELRTSSPMRPTAPNRPTLARLEEHSWLKNARPSRQETKQRTVACRDLSATRGTYPSSSPSFVVPPRSASRQRLGVHMGGHERGMSIVAKPGH